ncbi:MULTISPECIES: hypothetical protein [Gammaproteobacteria]|uniref:hypothetical protein n=1 Tax=Gammaproteobacteria TaxID=1236 RepID=UPI00112E85F6|nr:hypothetical protein [Pseudomonas sp. Hp2]
MTSVAQAPISTPAKALVVFFVVFGAVHLIDFVLYGQAMRNLVAGIAFAMMAYGTYANGFSRDTPNRRARQASLAGCALFLVYLALRYFA